MRRALLAVGIWAVASVGVAATPAKTSPSAARCAELANTIEHAVKVMGYTTAEGLVDNSAPRATMRATEISAKQAEIQSNIALMTANSCAPYDGPLAASTYLVEGMECQVATLEDLNSKRTGKEGPAKTADGILKACSVRDWPSKRPK